MSNPWLSNQINAVVTVAATYRATLPPMVQDVIDHADELGTRPAATVDPAETAHHVVTKHLGNRAAYEKARTAAIKELTTARIAAEFDTTAAQVTDELVWNTIYANRDAVVESIRDALKDRLDEAHTLALDLPEHIDTESLAQLSGDNYRTYRMFEQIAGGFDEITLGLAPLYDTVEIPRFSPQAARRLILVKPDTANLELQLAGHRHTRGGSGETIDPWVAVAHHGTYHLNTPREYAEVAEWVTAKINSRTLLVP